MSISLSFRLARVLAATKTLLPVPKLATPASFTLASRALTSTRNVLPARRFIPPPAFSQAFSADACEGKGDDNDDYEKNVHCEIGFRWLQNQVTGRRDWVVTMNPRPVFYRNLIDNAACGLNEDERSFVSHCGNEEKETKMALFSVSLKHAAARLRTGVFPARRIVFPASSSLSPTRSVFPAREIGPPVSFSRSYTTTTRNTGGDDDDPNLPRPCVIYKDEVSRESIVGLLAPPASGIRVRGFEDLPYEGKVPKYLFKLRIPMAAPKMVEGVLTYRIEVPGCGREDIKVALEDYELTVINLKKKDSEADRGEDAGLLLMLLVWPYYFKPHLITADVKDGILTVVVPTALATNV